MPWRLNAAHPHPSPRPAARSTRRHPTRDRHTPLFDISLQRKMFTGGNDTARNCAIDDETAAIIERVGDIQKPKQAMDFFTCKTYNKEGGQQLTGKCVFCVASVTSSGAQRLVEHLTEKCLLVPKEVKLGFRRLKENKEVRKAGKRALEATIMHERSIAVKREQAEFVQLGLRDSLGNAKTNVADAAIAKFFYANALSFAAASSEANSYYKEMVAAIQAAPANYTPPNAAKIAGTLLDACYNTMKKDLNGRDPDGTLKSKFGATYISDGWDSVDHLPLVNSAFICANDGGQYWRSVDTSGQTKSADYLASLMIADIYDFGCLNVVMVVTDTCSTMKKVWEIVEDEFPWISILPCQPHVISLLMKDVASLPEVKKTASISNTIISWFSHHHKPLAILREKCKQLFGKVYEIIKPGATRMGTHTLVAERLIKLKSALQATVVDPDYVAQNYKDLPDEMEMGNCEKIVREHKAGSAKAAVLDEQGYWSDLTQHFSITAPIFKLLRRHDSSAPSVGKLYSGWFEMMENVKTSDAPYMNKVHEFAENRWAYGHADIAAAAYVLDPEFISHEHSSIEEVMTGFFNTVEKIAVLLELRSQLQAAPEKYDDMWKRRRNLIVSDPSKQTTYDHYPKYPTTDNQTVKDFAAKVNSQLAIYKNKKGIFSRSWVIESAESMPAYLWWDNNAASTPELQTVARLVLAQPSSASVIERINSEFGFVKDRRRNRLSHSKADKLVSLFHNLRLMKRVANIAYTEPTVGWDVDANHSGITKWGMHNYA